jgi:hypothetical protein
MKTIMNPITHRALIVSGRFGFLPRNVFWSHVCRQRKTGSYGRWNKLLSSGLFKPYTAQPEYLYLSRSGIQYLQNENRFYVGKAHPMYFEHDEHVMNLTLACENAGLIHADWRPDAVLRMLTNTERTALLGGNSDKIPDVVFNLEVSGSLMRVAVEVEKSRKSAGRYDALVLSYLQMHAVNLVVIACNDQGIEKRIRNSMQKLGYPQSARPIAFCTIADIRNAPSSFPISLIGNVVPFDKFVSNLRTLENDDGAILTKINADTPAENSSRVCPRKFAV